MITVSQQLGIGLILVSFVLLFLFAYPKSPVRKYWWSISSKLMFAIPQELGYEPTVSKENISVWVDLSTHSVMMVNKIELKITQKEGIPSFEWKSHKVGGREHKRLDFKRPDWLGVGKYEAKLIAYTPDGFSKSDKFILDVAV